MNTFCVKVKSYQSLNKSIIPLKPGSVENPGGLNLSVPENHPLGRKSWKKQKIASRIFMWEVPNGIEVI